ncbi:MAG: enoyl-CoA hydratase/isomerase family protein [Proteobacteria bacterium]|nr:MAG: enoyl-CoA hydratase/isomerase family protein [Pseudomonadota bacterium]TDJ70845.1 MAG: enoyl-CoA hydratase/isomerase family protein [Pseudomonadota bacterium]
MTETLIVQRTGTIATVVLNRPEKLNALTKPMWQQLGEAVKTLSADPEVRCIVVRGAGDKAFAPGNDISEFENERSNVVQARAYGAIMRRTIEALEHCRHPMIAMIKGICVGGGLEIAANCDVRICGESSRFGIPINRLGLVMAHAELRGLLALVGRATTLEILLEGRVFGAEEAREKGLVNRIVADDQVEGEAYAAAQRIAEGAPLVARWHKKFINRLAESTPLTDEEIDEGFACFGTEDFQIGYRAFLDKVKPEFGGR